MIKFEQKNGIAIIKLNRPEKRNALHPVLINDLKEKLNEIEYDKNIRILIITGEGSSFCAGADLDYLNQLRKFSAIDNEKDISSIAGLFLQLYHFPKPTIAAVNGPAIAGGCGLATVCDFIIADELNAKFGYTEVKIGFIPAVVSIFLIKRIGEGNARQLLLSGELIDSWKAYEMGLANYLSKRVLEEAFNLANRLLENSDASMELTKKMINTVSLLNVDEAVNYCIELNIISRSSEDFLKGLMQFLNKK
ncbi:MAG TPA: enoyl-CoA hydratase/isomerase family protein [Ignavibacteriaceae bacterium]|nr:enoyl-CoA hydratase/isomerase family protein [Ignavibacteriaceae bacterium]